MMEEMAELYPELEAYLPVPEIEEVVDAAEEAVEEEVTQ